VVFTQRASKTTAGESIDCRLKTTARQGKPGHKALASTYAESTKSGRTCRRQQQPRNFRMKCELSEYTAAVAAAAATVRARGRYPRFPPVLYVIGLSGTESTSTRTTAAAGVVHHYHQHHVESSYIPLRCTAELSVYPWERSTLTDCVSTQGFGRLSGRA